MNKHKFLSVFYALPALIIGVYTMHYFQIPKNIWITNIGIYALCLIVSLFLSRLGSINPQIIIGVSVLLLLLSFFSDGISDVHRWVKISRINLNIGLIVSPIILIQLSRISNQYLSIFIAILVSLIFLFQPDASQVTAFSVAVSLILSSQVTNKAIRTLFLFVSVVLATISWYNLDDLQPINYVEGILTMANKVSVLLTIFAIIALILIPLPFFMEYHAKKNQVLFALGTYFTLTILSAFIGNFPVIIMGFGISPIIGYFMGIFWLLKTQNTTPQSE